MNTKINIDEARELSLNKIAETLMESDHGIDAWEEITMHAPNLGAALAGRMGICPIHHCDLEICDDDGTHDPDGPVDTDEYLRRVRQAIKVGDATVIATLTRRCHECGVMWPSDDHHRKINSYVVIGCEGYWQVDPALVNIPRGNWMAAK